MGTPDEGSGRALFMLGRNDVSLPKTVTLDGPAGSGKSTVGAAVAQRLDYLFVDTGAFYRAVTLAIMRAQALETTDAEITALSSRQRLDICPSLHADGQQLVLLNDEDVTEAIRDVEVEAHVSRISAISGVREVLNQRYRELAAAREHVIMAGRDIGTVVIPDADLKIYLDASLEVRAERRYRQSIAKGKSADRKHTQHSMAGRDKLDSQRAVAPLRPAPDARHINTDNLSIDVVIEQVVSLIKSWR